MARIVMLGESVLWPATEQRRRVGHHDRRRLGGADHDAADRTLGVVEHRANGMRELAGLAAEFVEAPAPTGREPRHSNRLEQLVRLQRRLEHAGHELLDGKPALARRPARDGLGAERGCAEI